MDDELVTTFCLLALGPEEDQVTYLEVMTVEVII